MNGYNPPTGNCTAGVVRATVYDGTAVFELLRGESTADWIRSRTIAQLERLASFNVRAIDVDPAAVRRLAYAELERRRPQDERGRAAASSAGARRRWVILLPTFTNYSKRGA